MLEKLEWDSNFFLKNIAEIKIENSQSIPLDNLQYDLIVSNQLDDSPLQINGYTELFKETKLIFIKNIFDVKSSENNEVKDSDDYTKDARFFSDLAYESGKMSRFRLDAKFGLSKFKELYDLWIINSLNKKFATKTFFIEKNEVAIGFVTLQQNNGIGKIGLIATLPDFQGLGLGRKLLEHTENYCAQNNIKYLQIATQKENLNACKFYEKMGYAVNEALIIKHFWRDGE